MKTLLITNYSPKFKASASLMSSAKKYGLVVKNIYTMNSFSNLNKQNVLQNIDYAIHRDINKLPSNDFYVNQIPTNTRQLNKEFMLKYVRYDKAIAYSHLALNGIPLIPSLYSFNNLKFKDICDYFNENRFLIKPRSASLGKGISLIQSQKELDIYYSMFKSYECILQKYIPIEWDIRVLIIGNKVIGAMKRNKPHKDSIVTNISQGGIGEKFILSPEIEMLALDVANTLSLEYAGIDILFDSNNKPYIIEVNATPQFDGFNKALNIQVEDLLVEYLISTKD
jgi:RimK family alpha-L-glutamate ligase